MKDLDLDKSIYFQFHISNYKLIFIAILSLSALVVHACYHIQWSIIELLVYAVCAIVFYECVSRVVHSASTQFLDINGDIQLQLPKETIVNYHEGKIKTIVYPNGNTTKIIYNKQLIDIDKELDNSHYLRLKQLVRSQIKQQEQYIKIRSSVTQTLWSRCDKGVQSQENTEAFKKFNTHMSEMREHKRKLKNLQATAKWIKQKASK